MILSFNTKYEHIIAISKKIESEPFHQPFNKKIDWGYTHKKKSLSNPYSFYNIDAFLLHIISEVII